ncbi:MAG: VOC family protein [Spirochaetales bacterium]|jgi:catechol 2,3-dioxygenase-like lactoylglutathione lyase family enzyme|nr:VOC family protein [Spirochaetales bacterium]
MINALAHVCIETGDLEKTREFYCDILGLQRQFDFQKEGKLFGYYLKICEGNYLEIFPASSLPEGRNPLKHFCLETGNIDVVIRSLEENGIEHSEKKLGADNSWQVWCRDPSGVDIEFHQYTPQSLQLLGGVCNVNW